jgi:GNAT superfamily N-acetyltransferase
VPGPSAPTVVRRADPAEFVRLRAIELDSDRLYEDIGMGPFDNDDGEDHLAQAAAVFVAGEPVVGFISLEVVDGEAHVDQVSVLPEHGRKGTGRALVEAAIGWAVGDGYSGITLTTFRDVPWNAPFYRTLGFTEVDQPAPTLAAIRAHEVAVGLDAHGPRIAMRRAL